MFIEFRDDFKIRAYLVNIESYDKGGWNWIDFLQPGTKEYGKGDKMYTLICEDYNSGNIHDNYIEAVERNVFGTEQDKFNYQLLDRCRCNCEYYLGNGNRDEKHL